MAIAFLLGSASIGCADRISLKAGPDGVASGPIACKLKDASSHRVWTVSGHDKGLAQADVEGQVWWWTQGIEPGKTVELTFSPASDAVNPEQSVNIEKTGDEMLTISAGGKPFTVLNFKKSEPRVYLYPVIGPTGVGVTRDYIMRDNALEKDNGRQDHPHHRSLWTAYGDIRIKDFDKAGYDFWAEPKNKPLPKQVLKKLVRTASGPVFGQIEAIIEWQTPDGLRVFSEDRTYTFFAGSANERIIDVKNIFHFDDMDVKFGQTKEGGMLALRLAVTMDEKGTKTPKALHGQATNSRGGIGAGANGQCWGKPAEWCDYVGPLDGEQVGVAVFDNPKNFRHPTTWHIRDYGLYTANPFMPTEKDKDNSRMFKKGEATEFNYRVVIHKGDTKAAHIAGQWSLYSSPPAISVE